MSLKALDGMKNIAVRTRASGERRRTVSVNDKLGKALSDANTPSEMGRLAVQHGITEEEILKRARSSPNFGQFRMVLGNRIRGAAKRMKANPGISWKDAANPPKRERQPGRKAAGSKKPVKKAVKSGSVGSASGGGAGDILYQPGTQVEAEKLAQSFGCRLEPMVPPQEYTVLEAAQAALRKVGTEDYTLVYNDDQSLIALVQLVKNTNYTTAAKKPVKKPVVRPAAPASPADA